LLGTKFKTELFKFTDVLTLVTGTLGAK